MGGSPSKSKDEKSPPPLETIGNIFAKSTQSISSLVTPSSPTVQSNEDYYNEYNADQGYKFSDHQQRKKQGKDKPNTYQQVNYIELINNLPKIKQLFGETPLGEMKRGRGLTPDEQKRLLDFLHQCIPIMHQINTDTDPDLREGVRKFITAFFDMIVRLGLVSHVGMQMAKMPGKVVTGTFNPSLRGATNAKNSIMNTMSYPFKSSQKNISNGGSNKKSKRSLKKKKLPKKNK